MSFLAFASLLALGLLLGWSLEPWWRAVPAGGAGAREPLESRLVAALVVGWVATDALLLFCSLWGVRWAWWSVGLPLLALAAMAVIADRRRRALPAPARVRSRAALGWGDGIAALALGTLVFFAARGEILFPDFVYHWGTKAQK